MPVEIQTPDKLEYQFLPISGYAFQFRVRSGNDAHLALTSAPVEAEPIYEIFLGGWGNTKSVIRRNRQKPDVVEVNTPDILSAGEFRGFWIRWYDNVITVGREGEAAAFMSYEAPDLFPVNFVGICTGWGAAGSWIVDSDGAPIASAPPMGFAPPAAGFAPPVGSGPGQWVPAEGGEVHPGAVQGGVDGDEQLYIARAQHEGDLIPGKLHPSHGVCYVAWGGVEHAKPEYEILVGAGAQWMPMAEGAPIPPNALPGGQTADGEPLYVGRASHEGTLTVGKVQPSHGSCYIPYGGEELAYREYEILVI